nr:MAG TPA: hypothetical protein [Caudoviricetes sp.]DAZ27650.1 MAG TPA: hypothetical protein [Caudoviricetes sp.]
MLLFLLTFVLIYSERVYLTCMGSQVQVLYRAPKSPGISRVPGLFIFAKINFVSNVLVVAI